MFVKTFTVLLSDAKQAAKILTIFFRIRTLFEFFSQSSCLLAVVVYFIFFLLPLAYCEVESCGGL